MYTLFIGFRKIDIFASISEAKKYANESDLTGVFTLLGEKYRDSWYKFNNDNTKNSNEQH